MRIASQGLFNKLSGSTETLEEVPFGGYGSDEGEESERIGCVVYWVDTQSDSCRRADARLARVAINVCCRQITTYSFQDKPAERCLTTVTGSQDIDDRCVISLLDLS